MMTQFHSDFIELFALNHVSSYTLRNAEGKVRTVRNQLSDSVVHNHVSRKGSAVGACPVIDGNKSLWGCIDVDDRANPINPVRLEPVVQQLALPLVCTQSKSGGTHLYLFMTKPAPASEVTRVLTNWAAALGIAAVSEVFPKQSKLASGDTGSCITLPYGVTTKTDTKAFIAGSWSAFGDFVNYSMTNRLKPSLLSAYTNTDMIEAPPCVAAFCKSKAMLKEGIRNSSLFNLAVYAKLSKLNPAAIYSWADGIIPLKEVNSTLDSVSKNNYPYKCTPLISFCDRKTCVTKEFGVGALLTDVGWGPLIKYDSIPPIWGLKVGGTEIKLSTRDLLSPNYCQMRAIEVLNRFIPSVKAERWNKIVSALMDELDVVGVPDEVSEDAAVRMIVLELLARATVAKENLPLGAPVRIDEAIYAKGNAVVDYINRHLNTHRTAAQLWPILHKTMSAKSVTVRWGNGGNELIRAWKFPDAET